MNENVKPVPDSYSVIYNHHKSIPMEGDNPWIITDAPSLVKLPDGALLCVVPMIIRDGKPKGEFNPLHFFRSDDAGEFWRKLDAESQFGCGCMFAHGDALFFMGIVKNPHLPKTSRKGPASAGGWFCIIRSDDGGESWTEPVQLFEARYNANSSYVKKNGHIYWCFDIGRDTPEAYTFVVAGDLNRDLTEPAAWRVSEPLEFPGVPDSLFVNQPEKYRWLEGNVIDTEEGLRVCWRLYSVGSPDIKNIAVICAMEDSGSTLEYRFLRYQPWPGAHNHFNVIYDNLSGLYWMTSNLIGASPAQLRQAGVGGRRILALHCSSDTVNWLPAGYVIVWPLLRQSSNYCGLLIDGDDLLVAARTSGNGRSHHDNDLTTFHRIKKFRKRAEHLKPHIENVNMNA